MILRLLRMLGLFAVVLGATAPAYAQSELEAGAPILRTFKPRDYQGSPVVARVLEHPQTGEMLMLAGTYLHVFDGSTWTAVQTDTPAIRCIGVDSAGRVWMGGVDQLGYCERDARGQWRFQPLADRLPEAHRKIGRFWDCFVVGDAVWLATDTKVVRWQNNAFTVWTLPSTGTLLAAGGQIFFQIKNQSLLRWNGTAFQEFSRHPLVAGASIMRLFATADGAFEGMNSAGAFFRIRGDRVEPFAPHVPASLGSARLLSALPRTGGGWYIGTDKTGLLIVDAEGRLVRHLARDNGFVDSPVLDLTRDRDGAVWAGTYSGPWQIEQPEGATFFTAAQGLPEGLSQGLERHQGRLYLSTPTGLLRLAPGKVAGAATFEPVPGTPRYAQKLLPQPDGLLIAHGGGVTRLHDEVFTAIVTSENPCVSLADSRRDPRWLFVGRSAGFTVFSRDAGRDQPAREVRHFPDLGQVRNVIEDENGAVWLATSTRGVHRIVPGTGENPWATATVTTFDHAAGTLPGPSNSTWLLTTPLGFLFHTDEGHVRFDASAGRFVADERFQLGNQIIGSFGVTALKPPHAWATANLDVKGGLPFFGRVEITAPNSARLTPAPAAIQEVLGPIDGGQILIEGDGDNLVVWSRTTEGLARLRPAALVAAPPDWRVTFTRFEAQGAVQPLAAAAPRFDYSRQPYVFGFHAVRLERGAAVEYQTRLGGWDADWSTFKNTAELRYSTLPAGDYRLEVRARDRLGRISSVATLAFGVNAPPWLTWWAFTGYALALAAVIFLYIRWRLGRVERERARLAALVEARTADLALARDAAEAASRAKSHFVASMSHELRTPLNSIIGYAQILATHEAATPWQRERLGVINTSGAHLLRLINDVLDFARVEAGRLEVRSAPFDLTGLLGEISAAGRVLAENKKLQWRLTLPSALPTAVVGDAARLRQVLDNLLGNAVKFTAAGEVALEVVRRGALYEFTVRDTGPGIAADDQTRLFHAFEQTATGANAGGAGLGLAISRQLAERMGGTLSVRSASGAGSAFTVVLPLPDSTGAAVAAPSGWQPPRGYTGPRRTLLVLDDVAQNRDVIRDTLEPLGFTVRDAADTTAARSVLAAGGIDLVILDLRLPGEDGFAFARWLRATPAHARLPVVAMSASVLPSQRADALAAGADLFLPKPFAQPELLDALAQLLKVTWLAGEATALTEGAVNGVRLPAPVVPTVPVPRDLLAEFSELATLGDIAALQALIEKLAASPGQAELAAELGALINAFELAALRQRLAALRAG